VGFSALIRASRPFTNGGELSVDRSWASVTASLIATPSGTSSAHSSSYTPIRRMFLSTAGIRSMVQSTRFQEISSSMRSRFEATPRTSAAAYGCTGKSPSDWRSDSSSSVGRPRSSASKRMSSARLRALLRAATYARPR
jgi:hypothetical protein